MTRSKIEAFKENKPSRFLVVKFGSLGDIVHCLPSVVQLRNAFPEADIDWLIERKNKIVVELSGLDVRLIPIDTYQWRNSPGIGSAKEMAELVWALSTDGYDCTIDFQGLLKSAFFAYLSGAPVRIGWERDFLKESVSRFFYTEVVTPKRIHIIDQQMELLRPLGIDPNWETEVPLRARDAARKSVERKLGGLADYILMNPGGNWPTKCWEPERYGELALRLMNDGFPVAVTWGPGEEELVRRLVRSAGNGIRARRRGCSWVAIRVRCISLPRPGPRSLLFLDPRAVIAMDRSGEKISWWNGVSHAALAMSAIVVRSSIGNAWWISRSITFMKRAASACY